MAGKTLTQYLEVDISPKIMVNTVERSDKYSADMAE